MPETTIKQEFNSVRTAIADTFEIRMQSERLPMAVFKPLLDTLRVADSYNALAKGVISLCEGIAKTTISKHLALIALDETALQAFCPKCGRHYRYHNKQTGECPKNPFDDTDSQHRQ